MTKEWGKKFEINWVKSGKNTQKATPFTFPLWDYFEITVLKELK